MLSVGRVTATAVQFAVNVTVPLVSLKFLKYVFFVELPDHAVVTVDELEPIFALLPSPALELDVHPENV